MAFNSDSKHSTPFIIYEAERIHSYTDITLAKFLDPNFTLVSKIGPFVIASLREMPGWSLSALGRLWASLTDIVLFWLSGVFLFLGLLVLLFVLPAPCATWARASISTFSSLLLSLTLRLCLEPLFKSKWVKWALSATATALLVAAVNDYTDRLCKLYPV